jgi:two-component system, LuxR family, response regulator FixJ
MVPVPGSSAEAHQATICVVEGDPVEREALYQLLSRLQHDVSVFESAESLLAALDQTRIQVLIAGLELPGMSGLELLHALREHGRQVPAIVLAGESDVATAVGAIRAGAVDFIQKPVIDRILLRRVRDALEHAGG